jgi:hypothetical protein
LALGDLHRAGAGEQSEKEGEKTTGEMHAACIPLAALHPTLLDVVNHYDAFFGLALTNAEKSNLVEYLKSL